LNPSIRDEAKERDIEVLNEEVEAGGIGKFARGLSPASSAKSLRAQPDGKVLVTDGPYLETKEPSTVFGYWKRTGMDEAGMGA
jgi:hypothetical protein